MSVKLYGVDQFYPGDFAPILTGVYNVLPLKEVFDIYGVDGLRSRTRNSDPSIRKLTRENERLKKMLAEKELEVSMLYEA